MTRMATGDVRNAYPAGAETAASSGAPAASAPTSSAPAALPARRHPGRCASALRTITWRRRKQWAVWRPLGIRACAPCKGEPCEYFEDAEQCASFRAWRKGRRLEFPPCVRERMALDGIATSLTLGGVPAGLATILGGLLFRASMAGDGKLHAEAAKHLTQIALELVRRKASVAAGKGAELDGYLGALLVAGGEGAGAPGTGGGNGGA